MRYGPQVFHSAAPSLDGPSPAASDAGGVDMSVRARRFAVVGLGVLTCASLLRTSISLGIARAGEHANLNLRLSEASVAGEGTLVDPASADGFWALSGPAAAALIPMVRASSPSQAPDGIRMVGLFVKVGPHASLPVLTNAGTPLELLGAMGVRLAQTDLVLPSAGAALEAGLKLRVVRIRKAVETRVETLRFETLIHYSRDVPVGSARVVTEGTTGQAVRSVEVTYRNGRPVDRTTLSYVLMTSPLPRVEVRGALYAAPLASHAQYGQASWYDCSGMYAAHLSLPFGTVVTVTNLDTGKAVTVVINDRGPFGIADRIIDLCSTAFAQIAPLAQGVARVKISW